MRAGDVLDRRYQLESCLGSGGMSVVWQAHDEVLDRPVAVKVLASPFAASPEERNRVREEAQSAARLWHPNVTSVYDYGETDESGQRLPYVVMELLPGPTLADEIATGPLPPPEALRICAEIAAALAVAHEHGVVHRDVKPSNVILTPAGAKVFDFGIAARVGQPEVEADGTVLGSPAYIAPERLAGEDVVPASDVYALGVLMYRTLTGDLPWRADTTTQILAAHVNEEPSQLPPDLEVPEEVRQINQRCLAREAGDRPSAEEVAAVLRDALRPREAVIPADPPAPVRGRRVRSLVVVAAAATALAGGGLAGLTLLGDGDRSDAVAVPPAVTSSGASGASTPPAAPSPTGGPSPTRGGPTGPFEEDGTTVPIGAQPPPPRTRKPPPAPTSAPPAGTDFTVLGGVVRVVCDGRKASVVSVVPNDGYVIKDLKEGPADEVQVVLRSTANESEIKVRCEHEQPEPRIKESPQR
jgi:eukaryotic-like serine/threonine-protein kinase